MFCQWFIFFWGGMVLVSHSMPSGVGWSVKNGRQVKFWMDSWLGPDPLCSVATSSLSL